jgi:predicted RNA binding protein YcfA (HicA-like mRNA interferase family)
MNSRQRKLIEKLVLHIESVTLTDCSALLEMFGWQWHKSPGGHRLYRKKGDLPFNLPIVGGRQIKRAYKTKLLEFLQERFPEEFIS